LRPWVHARQPSELYVSDVTLIHRSRLTLNFCEARCSLLRIRYARREKGAPTWGDKMKTWKQQLSPIFTVALLVLLAPPASAATYTLSGATYNPASLFGVYASATGITGSFTTASPLPANLANAPIAGGTGGLGLVTSWSFNDGVFTYTNANSDLWQNGVAAAHSFSVSTDSAGNITNFFIVLTIPGSGAVLGQPTEFMFLGFSGTGTSQAVRSTCIVLAPDGSCQGYSGAATDGASSTVPGSATFSGAGLPPCNCVNPNSLRCRQMRHRGICS
jgi:hypothetical protein